MIRYYALAGIAGVVLLNLLLRGFVRVGGIFATLLVALLAAAALALAFRWREGRPPSAAERWRLTALYGAGLGLLYLGLLGMMYLQDAPGAMGTALFFLHYLLYPLGLWLTLSPRLFGRG